MNRILPFIVESLEVRKWLVHILTWKYLSLSTNIKNSFEFSSKKIRFVSRLSVAFFIYHFKTFFDKETRHIVFHFFHEFKEIKEILKIKLPKTVHFGLRKIVLTWNHTDGRVFAPNSLFYSSKPILLANRQSVNK